MRKTNGNVNDLEIWTFGNVEITKHPLNTNELVLVKLTNMMVKGILS